MKKRALALVSGGLDSLLAAKIILEQGVHVEGINFFTGFSGDTPDELKSNIPSTLHSHSCSKAMAQLGIKLHVVDVIEAFKTVLLHPKYGYGANFNPCLDCKLFMINCAKQWMRKFGFDFLISGEVLGQRPMSQRKDTLPLGAKNSGDLLLRPLSAKLLAETLVERNGWVKRDELYAIGGRGRKEQVALAAKFGIQDYPQPAGGCVLTEHAYCARLQDLWRLPGNCFNHKDSQNMQNDQDNCYHQSNCQSACHEKKYTYDYNLDDIMLARLGRHLRVAPNLKLIVGRDQEDNQALANYQQKYPTMITADFPGALVILLGDFLSDDFWNSHLAKSSSINTTLNLNKTSNMINLELAARITARFSQGKNCQLVKVKLCYPIDASSSNMQDNINGNITIFEVAPLATDELKQSWYL